MLVLVLSKECNSNKKETSFRQTEITIIYKATSRGFFEEIKLNNSELIYCNDLRRETFTAYSYTNNDWEECINLLSKIEISSLPNLEAPTSYRLVDGAAHATLTIIQGDTTTQSSSFDHGHPPSSIKALVEKLISIKKMSIKK